MAVTAAMGVAYADYTPLNTPQEGNTNYTWTWEGGKWTKDDGTESDPAGEWIDSTYHGHYMIFKENKSGGTDDFPDCSDGGGMKVVSGVQVDNVSMGNYGGSIYVEENASLDAWVGSIKSAETSGKANVWVDGALNLRGYNALNWDGGDQYWHIGKDGVVTLQNASSITTNGKNWHIELVLEKVGEAEIPEITNRSLGTKTIIRKFVEAQGNISSAVTSLTVMDTDNNVLNQGTDYRYTTGTDGLAVEYDITGYNAMNLTWTGNTGSDWNHLGSNWADSNGVTTSFLNGDSVTFGTNATSKMVNIVEDITTGTISINDNYTFKVSVDSELTTNNLTIASEKTLTINGDATLTINGGISGNVTVDGGELSVSGAGAIANGTLTIKNGTVTAEHDGSENSVIAANTTIKVGTGGSLVLKGHDMLRWGNSSPAQILLESSNAAQVAKLDIQDENEGKTGMTGTTSYVMKGNAEITGTRLNSYDMSITATGTNNKLTLSEMHVRHALSIDVTNAGDELTIESKLVNTTANDDAKDITKTGAGTLVIDNNSNTWDKTLNVNAGILKMNEDANLAGTVKMATGTTLETGTGTIANLTMATGTTLDADTAITLGGVLELTSGITLDGGLYTTMMALEEGGSLTLFTGITTLKIDDVSYESAAREVFTPIDAASIFTNITTSGAYELAFANGSLTATMVIPSTPGVPEPATATLSLLALAGLAARRRRK